MIDKFKALGEALKTWLLFVILPLLALAAWVFSLVRAKDAAQEQTADLKVAGAVQEVKDEDTEKQNEANSSYTDYTKLRDEYKSGSDDPK